MSDAIWRKKKEDIRNIASRTLVRLAGHGDILDVGCPLFLLRHPTYASSGMTPHFTVQPFAKYAVVEFRTASLMDPIMLEEIGRELYRLVDEEDRRKLVLDFEKVQYLSSQAIGIILTLQKKLAALKHSRLVLCGVGSRLMELIRITRLDRILTIKPTQREAVKSIEFDA